MGPRSKTSLFYEAFSLNSGLDFSSDSSRDHPGDTSDSSSSSLSPTSGYSSYDLLDQVQPSYQDIDPHMSKRRSGIFQSVRDSHSNNNKPDNHKRSRSVPRITMLKYLSHISNPISNVSYSRNPQDYETGIKPASHRLESHSSSCSVHSNYPGSAVSTPKHSTTSNSVQKQIRSTNFRQKEYLPLEDFQTRKKVIFYHSFYTKFI